MQTAFKKKKKKKKMILKRNFKATQGEGEIKENIDQGV